MNGHLQLQRNCYYIIGMRHTYNHIRGVGNHLRYFSASIDSLACIVAIRCLQHGPPWLVLRGRSGVAIGYGYPKGMGDYKGHLPRYLTTTLLPHPLY